MRGVKTLRGCDVVVLTVSHSGVVTVVTTVRLV
jgi:hypothetical protein